MAQFGEINAAEKSMDHWVEGPSTVEVECVEESMCEHGLRPAAIVVGFIMDL
jgi:hypothetical protein